MRKAILMAVLLAFSAGAASADASPPLLKKKKAKRVYVMPPRTAYVPMPPPAPIPVPVPAVYDWTGVYAGGNIGASGALTKSDFSFGGTPFASAFNNLGGLNGGFQLGYNGQSGRTVFGVETDFQFTSQSGSIDAPPCPAAVCGVDTSASYAQKLPWFGTVRGRIGHASGTWLAYLTGGYAYARLNTDATATAGGTTVTASQNVLRSGWTAGGGIEVALERRWSAKLEYLYMDLGSREVSWTFTGLPTITDRIRLNENVVRGGLNYRF